MAGAAVGLAASSTLAGASYLVVLVVGGVGAGSMFALSRLALGRFRTFGRTSMICAVGLACLTIGAISGRLRIEAIDGGAVAAPSGSTVTVSGTVERWSRESDGSSLSVVSSAAGRFALRSAPGRVPGVGEIVSAQGTVRRPEPWRADWFRRNGVRIVIEARHWSPTGKHRGGIGGVLDAIRVRAEEALGGGVGQTEAALARGFVLGADQEIPLRTVEEFRRSGLAHLLAVSGQNVVLLSVLAWPLFALVGLRLNGRLIGTAALIGAYVLVTGAGPSILRAGIMGGAALVAAVAGRPSTRLHALCLAAAITLAINPFAIGDPGWLLSFAATAGILVWSRPLADLFGVENTQGALGRAMREAIAVTAAATLATAPLGFALFGTVSIISLPANLAAAPAVAPVMWLGMIIAMLGQVPGIPVEPLSALNGLGIGYVEWVAHTFGSPEWAMWHGPDGGGVTTRAALVLGSWIAIGASVKWLTASAGRRRGLRVTPAMRGRRWAIAALALGGLCALPVAVLLAAKGPGSPGHESTLVLCALDVGQGDSILIDVPGADAALVDTGPPGVDLAGMLRERGVERLSVLILTHDQLDHVGGAAEILRSMPVDRLVHAGVDSRLIGLAAYEGVDRQLVHEGSELRLARGLSIGVLWPPSGLLVGRPADANERSLVLLVRWRHFTALLTADAESEAAPTEPGPVDVIKIAHHGSRHEGLDHLLEVSVPKLALISVGEENTYGHPTSQTLRSLASHSVPALRTDLDGSVGAHVSKGSWWAGGC